MTWESGELEVKSTKHVIVINKPTKQVFGRYCGMPVTRFWYWACTVTKINQIRFTSDFEYSVVKLNFTMTTDCSGKQISQRFTNKEKTGFC